MATTSKVCGPCPSPEYASGDVQGTYPDPSRLQANVEPSSDEENSNCASVDAVRPEGPASIDVSGGVTSGGGSNVAAMLTRWPVGVARSSPIGSPATGASGVRRYSSVRAFVRSRQRLPPPPADRDMPMESPAWTATGVMATLIGSCGGAIGSVIVSALTLTTRPPGLAAGRSTTRRIVVSAAPLWKARVENAVSVPAVATR